MITIGVRELRNRLSLYLKQVAEGRQIKITNRGEVIALLIPAKGGKKISKELIALVEEGLASWVRRTAFGVSALFEEQNP
jgi:prevent-host-death family protein